MSLLPYFSSATDVSITHSHARVAPSMYVYREIPSETKSSECIKRFQQPIISSRPLPISCPEPVSNFANLRIRAITTSKLLRPSSLSAEDRSRHKAAYSADKIRPVFSTRRDYGQLILPFVSPLPPSPSAINSTVK